MLSVKREERDRCLLEATNRMAEYGCPFSENRLAALLADAGTRTDWKSEHQRKITMGRIRGLLYKIELDRRVHPTWIFNGASSGRWSSRNPSLQNLTQGQKQCIENRASVDVCQFEVYVAAVLAGEESLVEAYEEGLDLHQVVADELGIDRKRAKVFNLANLYGQTPFGIAKRLEISEDEAMEILDHWWSRYLNIHCYKTAIWQSVSECAIHSVRTEILSHQRELDLSNKSWMNQAYSHVVQGTAADLIKIAFVNLIESGVEVNAILHDEFIVPKENIGDAVEALRTAHPDFKLRVEVTVDL